MRAKLGHSMALSYQFHGSANLIVPLDCPKTVVTKLHHDPNLESKNL